MLRQSTCQKIFDKTLSLIDSDKVSCTYRKYKKWAGKFYHDTGVLAVNPRYDIIPTIMHEASHAIYPSYSEKRIMSIESSMMRFITHEMVNELLMSFCSNVIRNKSHIQSLGEQYFRKVR